MKNPQNSTESTPDLTSPQVQVISALVAGATVTDATKQANVDRTTFYLWLRADAMFQAEFNRAKQEHAESMRARLRGLAELAFSTLEKTLTGKNVPPGVRLRAALAVLQGAEALDTISTRILMHDDRMGTSERESAAEILQRRLREIAERRSSEGLSGNGSVG